MARENAARAGVANIVFLQSDWFSALTGRSFATAATASSDHASPTTGAGSILKSPEW